MQDYYKAIVASMTDIDLGIGNQNQGGPPQGSSFQVSAHNSGPRGGSQPPPPSYPSGGQSGGAEEDNGGGAPERGGSGTASGATPTDGGAPKRPAGIGIACSPADPARPV